MNLKELALELEMEPEEIRELLEIFIESSKSDLDKLKMAIDQADQKMAADAAHSIKGASANLGFMDISSVAKSIEHKVRNNGLADLNDEVLFIKDQLSAISKSIVDISLTG